MVEAQVATVEHELFCERRLVPSVVRLSGGPPSPPLVFGLLGPIFTC